MAEPAPVDATETQPQPQPLKSTPRILVVEDDARMRRVLEMLLSGHWTVETAADAPAALTAVRENPPDLVLTDLLLPGMDGFDFLRKLRAQAGARTLPVIVISGLTEESDRLKALEAGAQDYLIKPFSEKELLLRVTTHLEMAFLRREAALRESEAQLRAILEGALDAVVGMDASGLVIDWNQQAEATFGYAREEAMGRRLSDLIIPPEFREAHERGMEAFLETGHGPMLNRRVEVEGQRKDATRIPLELAITVVKGWGFYRFNAFCRDISDRRQADAERNRLLEDARAANRMKDEFLAMLSHELRTPLSAIVGWAHMLRTGGLDEATATRAIETIDRNAKVQNQLIEDILDVSRIVAGKFHLDMRPVDLARVVEGACDTVAPTAAAKGVELKQELDPEVRPCCPAIGDPERLQQVVWNLLNNSIKFTPRGGTVTLSMRRLSDPPEFEIVVRDTGSGIAPEFLPHIFERFRQAGTGTRRHGGLGLGLSIVRHIVEMHGGSVQAESAGEGQGSTFSVRFPVVDMGAEAQRVLPVSHEDAGLDQSPRLDGVRVLVVEDEADARHLLAAVLQKRGARVFMAASAAEALDLLQRERPDVLLSDIALQDQDGYDLIRRVRSLPSEMGGRTPAAALTGYGRLEDRMRALSAGFQLHAAKPVEPAELVAVVASLAGKSSR
ncbi:MAG TPA: response regulator [Vicinamibacteria bacterium]|nr:response regulator [Vicinamibacteria bacterium]